MADKINFLDLSSEDVKKALRLRHPATAQKYGRTIPGPWTSIEEWKKIDFLSISAVKSPTPGAGKATYPWIGYEIKVSRSDMRSELLDPKKREKGKRYCDAFYFATPQGMLTDSEKKFKEPSWQQSDFNRDRCPSGCVQKRRRRRSAKSSSQFGVWDNSGRWKACSECKGKGYIGKSLVEEKAPTLWLPKDVGLVEVDKYGFAKVIKRAPVLKNSRSKISTRDWNALIRWVSLRPDPGHSGVIKELSRKQDD